MLEACPGLSLGRGCEEHWVAVAAWHVRGVPARLAPGTSRLPDMFFRTEGESICTYMERGIEQCMDEGGCHK